MKATALHFLAPRMLALVEQDLPQLTSGDILVRTVYSGISAGTELLVYRGEVDHSAARDDTIGALAGTFSYPFGYGYSCTGIVEESAGDFPVGSLVFAFHPHQDRFVSPSDEVIPLDGIDARTGTLFPLVETALQITLDAGEVLEETVIVMGLGAVGLLTAVMLQRAGANVLGTEPSRWRRSRASDLGVAAVGPEEGADRVAHLTSGEGVPLVIDVSGNPEALPAALPLLAHEGTALVASWYGTNHVTLPLGAEFHRRRLTIRSTQVSTIPAHLTPRWTRERRRRAVSAMLPDLPLKELATHEFPFTRAAEAFARLDSGDDTILHAALDHSDS